MAASAQLYGLETMGLLSAVLESATNAAIVYDAEHDYLLANHKALELHGMPPASASFEEWGAYYDARRPGGEPLLTGELPLSRARRGERVPEMRLEIRPRLGGTRLVDVRAEPLFDADRELIGAMAVFRDAASAEEALRHAEERFRKVFEEGPVGIVMFDADLSISDCNEAFCRITGFSRDELVGMNMGDVTHPADAPRDIERVQRVFSGQVPNYRSEKRCLTKDCETVWTSFTATVVRDDARRPLYGLGIVEDISERKRIEALMVRQNERLATDLETSLAELQLSRARILASADLERRRIERDLHDGAQQRLVALRVRLGLAQDLLRDDPVRGTALLKELGSDVDAAIDEVRLLARGVYPAVLADRGLVEALRAAARSCPLSVRVRSRAIGRFPVDIETAVYFTCVEALQNAAKHAGCETSVLVSLSQSESLRFDVRDDGVGFSLSRTAIGAGLTNMRDRIESVGGQLTIESVPGEGTCVSGSVPLR